jgi:hypothetical protein
MNNPFRYDENQEIGTILAQCYQLAIARDRAGKCDESRRQSEKTRQKNERPNQSGKTGLQSDSFGLESASRTIPWPKTG